MDEKKKAALKAKVASMPESVKREMVRITEIAVMSQTIAALSEDQKALVLLFVAAMHHVGTDHPIVVVAGEEDVSLAFVSDPEARKLLDRAVEVQDAADEAEKARKS